MLANLLRFLLRHCLGLTRVILNFFFDLLFRPLSFFGSWETPPSRTVAVPPPHPAMPPYSSSQKRLIAQFIECTEARDSIAAKVCCSTILSLFFDKV